MKKALLLSLICFVGSSYAMFTPNQRDTIHQISTLGLLLNIRSTVTGLVAIKARHYKHNWQLDACKEEAKRKYPAYRFPGHPHNNQYFNEILECYQDRLSKIRI